MGGERDIKSGFYAGYEFTSSVLHSHSYSYSLVSFLLDLDFTADIQARFYSSITANTALYIPTPPFNTRFNRGIQQKCPSDLEYLKKNSCTHWA